MRLLAAAVAAVLLAGCSSGDPEAGPTPSASSAPASGTPTGAPGSATPSGAASAPAATPSTLPPKSGPPKLARVGVFTNPTHIAAPPGDPRVFVVEQTGRIKIVKDGQTLPAPFLDISKITRRRGEQGLLSMAFAPDYPSSGLFYVHHNGTDGAVRVAEYRTSSDPDRADGGSRRELLRIEKHAENHNGGQLQFDDDGMLLISTGDGGAGNDPPNNAQDLGVLLGKILRIDPKPSGGKPYTVPRDNPFVGRSGARGEVWAYGLRNPWRFWLDLPTGDFYVGDVGQYVIEELSAVPASRAAGGNFGWRVYEGRRRNFADQKPNPAGPLIAPVHQFNHGGGRCVITSGVVYRGSVTALRDQFLFGEFCTGAVWSIPAGTADDPKVTTLKFEAPNVTSFGVDGFGEVYLAGAGGSVWKITA